MRTTFPQQNEEITESRTNPAQVSPQSEGKRVRFPVTVKLRNLTARIYGKSAGYDFYRVGWHSQGKRRLRSFPNYSEARQFAERTLRELAQGSQAASLSPKQALDALAALERLEAFRQATGRQLSINAAVAEFIEAAAQAHPHTLHDAVKGYLDSVASVKRRDISAAVAEYIAANEPRTHAPEGQRSQLSEKFAYNVELQLRRFKTVFRNSSVSDLTKDHLNHFMHELKGYSAKTRNHYRATIKSFLAWCVRRDYLAVTHRLCEADTLIPERANTAPVAIYSSKQLDSLLQAADGPIRALIAIGGLAGLRTAELLRLDWADVWRVPGQIEVTALNAKTRARRLVEVCASLAGWLEPFKACKSGLIWTGNETAYHKAFNAVCTSTGIERKDNALRHSFCTFHLVKCGNENLTAAQSGNSPAMIHSNYRALATPAEAEKWFAVSPVVPGNVIPMPRKEVNA